MSAPTAPVLEWCESIQPRERNPPLQHILHVALDQWNRCHASFRTYSRRDSRNRKLHVRLIELQQSGAKVLYDILWTPKLASQGSGVRPCFRMRRAVTTPNLDRYPPRLQQMLSMTCFRVGFHSSCTASDVLPTWAGILRRRWPQVLRLPHSLESPQSLSDRKQEM